MLSFFTGFCLIAIFFTCLLASYFSSLVNTYSCLVRFPTSILVLSSIDLQELFIYFEKINLSSFINAEIFPPIYGCLLVLRKGFVALPKFNIYEGKAITFHQVSYVAFVFGSHGGKSTPETH